METINQKRRYKLPMIVKSATMIAQRLSPGESQIGLYLLQILGVLVASLSGAVLLYLPISVISNGLPYSVIGYDFYGIHLLVMWFGVLFIGVILLVIAFESNASTNRNKMADMSIIEIMDIGSIFTIHVIASILTFASLSTIPQQFVGSFTLGSITLVILNDLAKRISN